MKLSKALTLAVSLTLNFSMELYLTHSTHDPVTFFLKKADGYVIVSFMTLLTILKAGIECYVQAMNLMSVIVIIIMLAVT